MEIINRLKNTPTGLIVLYYNGQNKIPCRGCVFRDDGARFCEYSSACMAHLRPDHESVVFAKTEV